MKNKTSSYSIWVTIGSVLLALLGFVSSCAFPAIAALLAVLGVGSGFVSFIKPLQPWLISLAALSLAFEFYKAYRPLPKNSKCCGSRTRTRIVLWSMLVVFGGLMMVGKMKSMPAETAGTPSCAAPTQLPTCPAFFQPGPDGKE
ncbi:hypothetical protein P4E94_08525 [Pontiellaceae bacterium B12219]|nr:hypothetical protein [Pontiellaceae bacterium B12219]